MREGSPANYMQRSIRHDLSTDPRSSPHNARTFCNRLSANSRTAKGQGIYNEVTRAAIMAKALLPTRRMLRTVIYFAGVLFLTADATSVQGPQVYLQLNHSGEVRSLDISDNDIYAVSAADDGSVKLWRLADHRLV